MKSKIAEYQRQMPQGYDIAYPKDSTEFIKISVEDVIQTLFEAIILVVCVMYLFLQNFRATLIPAVAVPVVLLGTFGVLALFGYSINTLTLFAMVLAIGLLVDDAIVVVENVERIMRDEGLPAREATENRWAKSPGADRDCAGAVGGILTDGLLWRLDRRDLSPVLGDHYLGDDAVGGGGSHPNAGAVWRAAPTLSRIPKGSSGRLTACGAVPNRAISIACSAGYAALP